MSTENVEVFNRYYGNGVATQFSIGFPYLKREFVKVYLYKKDTDEEKVLNSDQFSFVNDATIQYPVLPTDEILKEGDILTIQRETTLGSEFEFDNQRRLFPVEVMNADDLAFQQIQELSREIKRAVRVNPTADETPEELLNEVYGKLDSASEIANEAIIAAGQATVAAEQATAAVEEAQEQIIQTQEYIDEKRAEVDTIVAEAEASVDNAITQATEDVKQAALDAANEAINDAAATATGIVLEYTNNELKPELMAYATSADEDAKAAEDWAKTSKIWATGEDEEVNTVAPGEEEHSSRGYADLAMAIANTPENVPVDASKLLALDVIRGEKGDKGDRGDAGKDGKIGIESFSTNCITEIPQDIKLELNDGTLTLKAGSKVYVPNGFEADGVTPKFDIYTETVDKTILLTDNGSQFICVDANTGSLQARPVQNSVSGAGVTTTYGLAYNTTTNKIRFYNADGVDRGFNNSLPIAIVTVSSGIITSIDQVFNGFGYIGSTVFALPNVKGLIPNGRNADGSLKNIEFTVDKVLTFTTFYDYNGNNSFKFAYQNGGLSLTQGYVSYWFEGSSKNIPPKQSGHLLNTDDNEWYYCPNGDAWIIDPIKYCVYTENCGLDTNGVINSFTPKTTFHAVDRNDSSWVSAQAMPSNKYIDLTLGATGSNYTAPANGYFMFRRDTTSGYVGMEIVGKIFNVTQNNTGTSAATSIFCPAQKGDTCKIVYTGSASGTPTLKFIYAEGEN